MKKLFIHLEVQDGERRHDHRILHTTNAKNIFFAGERYASTYWGYGTHEGDWWWFDGEIALRVCNVIELTDEEFEVLNRIIYY